MSAPVILEVKTFGEFSISRNKGTEKFVISERDNFSKKLWGLLEYLVLFRRRGATREELIDAFWGEDCGESPENCLKALIFRARRTVSALGFAKEGREIILYSNNSYRFNEDISFRVDSEQFDTLCRTAETERLPLPRLKNALHALEIYDGDFLPRSVDFPWAASLNIYYRDKFLKLCTSSVQTLFHEGRHEDAIRICRKALTIDPYDETLHRLLIEAFIATGAISAASQHYTYITNLFISELAISPSKELTALYHKINTCPDKKADDLHSVRDALQESESGESPFFCGYAAFENIYRFKARITGRSGEAVQLAMLSLLPPSGKQLSPIQLRKGMEYLLQAISSSLRMGDVFCRYNAVSYLILLPSADSESGMRAVERILCRFRALHPRVSYSVGHTLLSVLPKKKSSAVPRP